MSTTLVNLVQSPRMALFGGLTFLVILAFVSSVIAYDPDRHNVYHIFTRRNPSRSQPMLLGQTALLRASSFDNRRRTVFLIHGWTQNVNSEINHVLVPAFLRAEEINVVAVDWGVGANIIQGNNGPNNAINSGRSVARAIDWICRETGISLNTVMVVGFSLGAHQAAVVGRSVSGGRIPYIVALDPGANMENSGHMFSQNAATYTEAIHTNAEIMGHGRPIAHADFYPNGGDIQPGCGINFLCNHYRSFHFFAESLYTNGFIGRRCGSYAQARLGTCILPGNLRMGGLNPKSGSGIFHLVTNDRYPFNRG